MEPTAGDGWTLEDKIKAGGCLALAPPTRLSLTVNKLSHPQDEAL